MLLAEDSLYADLFDAAPDGLLVVSSTGRVELANTAAHRLLGWPPGTLPGRSLEELIPGRATTGETLARRRDRSELPVEIRVSRVHASLRCVAFRDVTARRERQRKLHESEERFRLLVDGVRDYAIFFLDLEGRVLTWNAGAERIKGYRAEEIIGESMHRFYLPEDIAAGVPERLLQRAAAEGVAHDEGVRLRKDGSRFWAHVVLTALHDEDGRPRGFAKVTRDITEQKRAADERESLLERLKVVLERCPVGILLFDGREAERVEANGYAENLMGARVDRTGGLGQFLTRLFRADGRPVHLEELPSYRALHGETIAAGEEFLLRRHDGIDLPVLVSAAPLRDRAGEVDGAVVAFDEISAIKELERLRAEWTSVVAHDLRQPLNAILAHATLLGRKATDDKSKERAQVIASSARRLNRMIHDLLDLSRLEANRLSVEHQRIEVPELVRQAVERQKVLAPDRELQLTVRPHIGAIEGDPDRLDQVLDNLLSNAVKYSASETPIDVEVAPDGDGVAIAVTNRGPGLSREQLARLFQRFSGGPRRKESVGLGLYITKGLVEAHGGQIEASSTPGDRTTFRVRLPAA